MAVSDCNTCRFFTGWKKGRGQCLALPEAARPGAFWQQKKDGKAGVLRAEGVYLIKNCQAWQAMDKNPKPQA